MPETDFEEADWRERIRAHRAAKDEFFASDPESPIPDAEQAEFEGLAYFPLDPAYRFSARWEPLSSPETVSLGANRGPDMEFEHVGNVGITLEGELTVLRVYRSAGVEDLLVPFRDETNGSETWQHGRYLSLESPGPDVAEVVVDFNLAYHPFCVYDESIVCAIPPKENELPTAIRAGERR